LLSSTDCESLLLNVGSNNPSPQSINITANQIIIIECTNTLTTINHKPIISPINHIIQIFLSLKCFNKRGNKKARENISQAPASVKIPPISAGHQL
jgi:hypothetical protein